MTENNLTEDHVRRYPNEDSGFFHAQNHFHAVSLSGGKDNEKKYKMKSYLQKD